MKTVFLRVLDPPPEAKGAALLGEIRQRTGSEQLNAVDISSFNLIPGTPFAYWVTEDLVTLFAVSLTLKDKGYSLNQGLITADDSRFLRLRWETDGKPGWSPFAKGSTKEGFLSEFAVSVRTDTGFRELIVSANNKYPYLKGGAAKMLHAVPELFGLPGLAYTRRTTSRFRTVALEAGAYFSDKLPLVANRETPFDKAELLFLLGVTCSQTFAYLVELSMGAADAAARSYETGIIERVPLPKCLGNETATSIRTITRELWRCRRTNLTASETSRHFVAPEILAFGDGDLKDRCAAVSERYDGIRSSEVVLTEQLERYVADAYGLTEEGRSAVGRASSFVNGEQHDEESDDEESSEDGSVEFDGAPMVASLLSWSVGVAFGRFDVRLVTGEREVPPEPEPFDPLPVCSPGMLTGGDGLPVAAPPARYPLTFPTDGILVDDPGHPRDVVRAVRAVFEAVFDDADARRHEAAELLGAPDLRTWFAREFFESHIKRYSKSRRKAPIYWQLATASGSYSVWIYIHRATGDTLFRVLNDFVSPKLDHEKARLDELIQGAGVRGQGAGGGTAAVQRREIERREAFVGELQALKTEVARVASVWKPNLDDGVILNFAPLWRLVPQSRSWQGQCKKAWDKLVAGDYNWAHLAMHLWPERVVQECIDDRSLAIAHGLENVFWQQDDTGTWCKRQIDDATVQRLIQERTSTTVKAALMDLLSAAMPTANKGRKAKGRSELPRNSVPKATPAAARATPSDTAVNEATLRAVKAVIARMAGEGASKADVLAATGLSEAFWSKAISALLHRGEVTCTGQKRGTRYHADSLGEEG